MFNSVRSKNPNLATVRLNPVSVLLVPCDTVVNGTIVHRSEFKAIDNAEFLLPFRSSDFSVSSLLAVGALDKMKNCVVNTSRISAADKFDNVQITQDVQK